MCDAKPDRKSLFVLNGVNGATVVGVVVDGVGVLRCMSAVNAPLADAVGWVDEAARGDGLRLSSSSSDEEFANGGDPVTDMLSFSNPSSMLLLLSLSSVWVGVICAEFVTEMFVGDPLGLVVLCGLHIEF